MHKHMCKVNKARAAVDLMRNEKLRGDDYIVVPVVALVEGVLHPANAEMPELALAEEFGRFAAGWDGRPIIMNHPQQGDMYVSGNLSSVWDDQVIGYMFNTSLEDKKLKTEAWLNTSWAPQELIDNLQKDVMYEVSTGLFADVEETSGVYAGEDYSGIWRNIVPDHLAILSLGTKGACSIEDGCGTPRVNINPTIANQQKEPVMSDSASPQCCKEAETPGTHKSLVRRVLDMFRHEGFQPEPQVNSTHSDVQFALGVALRKKAKETGRDCYVASVDDSVVTYESYGYDNATGEWVSGYFQRSYSISDDGVITLGDSEQEVRPETSWIPVVVNSEAIMSDTPAAPDTAVKDPVDNQATVQEQPQGDSVAAAEPTTNEAHAAAATPVVLSSVTAVLQAVSPDVATELQEAIEIRANHKKELVQKIMSAAGNQFTAEELDNRSISDLNKIVSLTQGVSYAGQGAQQPVANTGKGPEFIEPPKVFSKA